MPCSVYWFRCPQCSVTIATDICVFGCVGYEKEQTGKEYDCVGCDGAVQPKSVFEHRMNYLGNTLEIESDGADGPTQHIRPATANDQRGKQLKPLIATAMRYE